MSRSRISHAKMVGFSLLYCSILLTTAGVATFGFEPPITVEGCGGGGGGAIIAGPKCPNNDWCGVGPNAPTNGGPFGVAAAAVAAGPIRLNNDAIDGVCIDCGVLVVGDVPLRVVDVGDDVLLESTIRPKLNGSL